MLDEATSGKMRAVDDAYAHYQVDDEPTLVPSAVLFLDVLGTDTCRSAEEAQAYLSVTHTAFERARSWGESKHGASDLSVAAWFSDNLAMAVPVPHTGGLGPADAISMLVTYAALHQLSLADHCLFARGAITFGSFYADTEFVHGPALNTAYRLESKRAVYPRVILDEPAMRALNGRYGPQDGYESRLLVGHDGLPFVDYLSYLEYMTLEPDHEPNAARDHRDRICHELDAAHPPSVHEKYVWSASYHDYRARGYGDDVLVSYERSVGPPFVAVGAEPAAG